MTDEMKDTVAEKIDPRETPAFRGVLKQLEAERSEKAALADRLRALEDESNTRKQAAERKQLEQAGKYEEALRAEQSAWETRHAAIQHELAQAKAEYERTRVVADLAAHGVTGKARDFLASSYLSNAEKPDLGEWIEAAKTDAEYGMFFTAAKARAPQPGDVGGRAAGPNAGKTDWAAVKADRDSRDPAKSRAAIRLIKEHFEQTGQSPFK
jgi:hypothetical protein